MIGTRDQHREAFAEVNEQPTRGGLIRLTHTAMIRYADPPGRMNLEKSSGFQIRTRTLK